MTDKAYAVPLHEQLASVPRDARLIIDDADGMGTRFIPVGRMCHEAAEALRARLAQPEPEPVAWMYDWYDETEDIDGVPIGGIVHDWISKDYDEAHSPTMGCHNIRPLYTAPPQQPERKLWLWKNFVDGRPEYWAFDNPYPTNLDNGDPQTLGQPCGYAIFKPSRDGSRGRTEEQVLREMESVSAPPQREWQGLTDEEYEAMAEDYVTNCYFDTLKYARAIEAALKAKNG